MDITLFIVFHVIALIVGFIYSYITQR